MLASKSIRESIWDIVKILFGRTFLVIYAILFSYLGVMLHWLYSSEIWGLAQAKDVLFWTFSVAIISIFNTKKKDSAYFSGVILDGLKWTAILEFVVNFYSFSLTVELVLIPFIIFLSLMQAVAETKTEYAALSKQLYNLLAIFGLMIICFTAYKTVTDSGSFFRFETLFDFFLPVLLTVLLIPFLYGLALFSEYESYFTYLNVITNKYDQVKETKRLVLLTANFNLFKLGRIRKNFSKSVYYDGTDLKDYIRKISLK